MTAEHIQVPGVEAEHFLIAIYTFDYHRQSIYLATGQQRETTL